MRARRHCCTETNLGSDWSVMLLGRGPTIQIYIAGNVALHGESYDCAKAAILLEHSNSFLWPEDCVQIHQTPFPSQRVGSGHEPSRTVLTSRALLERDCDANLKGPREGLSVLLSRII